jgi:fucose 4-O-acetylase-like acetyltransferase
MLTVPMVVALLWLGSLWRTMERDGWLMAIALPAGVVVAVMLARWHVPPLNMKVGDYGWPLVSLIAAVLLSLALCRVARAAPLKLFCRLGQMSLVIMYLHVAVIHYLTPYMSKYLILLAALVVPVAAFEVMKKFTLTRRLYLGQV